MLLRAQGEIIEKVNTSEMNSQTEFKEQKKKALDLLQNMFDDVAKGEAESEKSAEELKKEATAALEKLLGDCKSPEDMKRVVEDMAKLCKQNEAAVQAKAKKDQKKGKLLLKTWKALWTTVKFLVSSTAEFLWKRVKGVVRTATAIVVLIGMLWCWKPAVVEAAYKFLIEFGKTVEQAHTDGKQGAKTAGEKVLPLAKQTQKTVDKVDNDASSGAKGAATSALKWLKK